MMWTCQNNLGFSLCITLSVCYIITISENWIKSKERVSTDVGMLPFEHWKSSSIEIYLC